jgi:hypothetical protein
MQDTPQVFFGLAIGFSCATVRDNAHSLNGRLPLRQNRSQVQHND